MATVRPEIEVTDEFLSQVLTNAVEQPFGQWFDWRKVERDAAGLIIKASGKCDTKTSNEGEYPRRVMVNLESVRTGITRILSRRMVNGDYSGAVLMGALENDAGRLDMVASDAVLQAAVYNEIVFG